MIRGWFKIWRKIGDNDILKDPTALQVFIYLLAIVDKQTGEKRVGRFWVSEALGIKPNTFYKSLKRLEQKYKVVNIKSNNKFSLISFINWHKYQSSNTPSNNKVTTKEQQSNNKVTHNKNIEYRIKNKEYINNITLAKPMPQENKIPLKRKEIQFPKAVLDDVVNYYVQKKGITPQGNEWLPIQQAVKSMFLNGRLPEDIKDFIYWLSTNWGTWDIHTVMKRMPEFLAGKLDKDKNKVNQVKNDKILIRLHQLKEKGDLSDGEFREKMNLLSRLEQKYPAYKYENEWKEIRQILNQKLNAYAKVS